MYLLHKAHTFSQLYSWRNAEAVVYEEATASATMGTVGASRQAYVWCRGLKPMALRLLQ